MRVSIGRRLRASTSPYVRLGVRFVFAAIAVATSLLAIATPLPCQARQAPVRLRRLRPLISLEGAGLISTVNGDALDNAGEGAGFDAMTSVGNRAFSLGAGFQRSSHALGTTNTSVVISGPFIEPRVAFSLADGDATPYLFVRAAYLTRTSDATGDHRVHGTAFGGGIGTFIWLAPNLQLNTGVMWQDLRFDRPGAGILPVPGVTTRVSGSQWSLRAGLVVGLGGWK